LGLGSAFNYTDDFESSRKCFLKALIVAEQINDKVLQKEVYVNLGNVYYDSCKFDSAVKSYLKSKEISQDLGDREEEDNACLRLGDTFQQLEQHEKAFEYFQKAININKELKNTNWLTLFLTFASYFSKKCDYKVASEWYEKALDIYGTEFNDDVLQEQALIDLRFVRFNLRYAEKIIEWIEEAQTFVKKPAGTGNYFR
jgi:tetratricopeptide (TPR) repeat protein